MDREQVIEALKNLADVCEDEPLQGVLLGVLGSALDGSERDLLVWLAPFCQSHRRIDLSLIRKMTQ
jgi:hypothetical protein